MKQTILPSLIKSDGTVEQPTCTGPCTQANLTAHIELKTRTEAQSITSRIQTIVSETKSGDGTVASFKDVFSQGLAVLSFRSGQYENGASLSNYTDSLRVDYFKLLGDLSRISKVLVGNGWYTNHDPNHDWVTLWDGTKWLEFEDNSDFGGTPSLEGNCVSFVKTGTTAKIQKACLTAKDLSGKKMGEIFPEICKSGGSAISGCNVNSPLPAGSYGYEMGFETMTSNIDFSISDNWIGYEPTLSDFVNKHTSSTTDLQWMGDGCNVGFYLIPDKNTDNSFKSTGLIKWTENTNPGCNGHDVVDFSKGETTNYAIREFGGKEVLIVDVPSIYRKLNPGDMMGCKFAFAVVKNIDKNPGVHSGDYCDANTRSKIPFTGNLKTGMQFMSVTLFKHLVSQRGITAFPGI